MLGLINAVSFTSRNLTSKSVLKCLVYTVRVMPALLSALRFSKLWQTLFRLQTRKICDVFPKHGLSINAIRNLTLAVGVTEGLFRPCDSN